GTITVDAVPRVTPFANVLPTDFRSSPNVTPGGTLFVPGFAGPLTRIGLTATVTSPFVRCTSCRPELADTEIAPCRVSDPPGKVTELFPLETVIVPGELDVMVRPLPLKIAEL